MLNTLKYALLSLMRNRAIVIWALAFPIILSSCFMMMFQGLDDVSESASVRAAIVRDGAYDDAPAFSSFIEAVGDEETGVLDVTFADDVEAARSLVLESQDSDDALAGYAFVDDEGLPVVGVAPMTASNVANMMSANEAVLVTLMDEFRGRTLLARDIAAKNPMALADPDVSASLFERMDATRKVTITESAPSESARYYFALLGMAAMFGAQASLIAILALLPSTSALGARRALGGTSRIAALAGCILASWIVSFVCLSIAFLFIKEVAGVDIAGRDLQCIAVLAAAAFMATALGALVACVPKLPAGAKAGILTGLTCFAALFSGLYGQPTMELADMVEAACPASALVNPAAQVAKGMYALMYYDSFAPCFGHVCVLLVMGVIFFAVAARFLGRQRYASL